MSKRENTPSIEMTEKSPEPFPRYSEIKKIFDEVLDKEKAVLILVGHKGDHVKGLIDMGLLTEDMPLELMAVGKTYGMEHLAKEHILLHGSGEAPEYSQYEGIFHDLQPCEHKTIIETIEKAAEEDKKVIILAPFPNISLEEWLENENVMITCASPEQFVSVENKNTFSQIAEKAFPENVIPYELINPKEEHSFSDLCKKLKAEKLVVQNSVSGGGDGTLFARNQEELQAAIERFDRSSENSDEKIELKISRFQEGYESNGQACVINGKVYVDPPSHKPVGLEAAGSSPASGSGNDWTNSFPPELLNQYKEIMVKTGEHLYQEYGYQGIFGVDSIFDLENQTLWPHEINPRTQGTTPYQIYNARMAQRIPTDIISYLAHFAEAGLIEQKKLERILPNPDKYNEKSIESPGCWYIKLSNRGGKPGHVIEDMSGVFELREKGLIKRPDKKETDVISNRDKNLVALRGPAKGSRVEKGLTPFAYVFGSGFSVFQKDNPEMTETGKKLLDLVYEKFIKSND
ncbi:MAG: hypothetical protein GF347_03975 [Candidatus Moranbacteria bacterium]|nr:hypothetical protein [Candidatus Moranbacteria bacterium]